MRIAVATWNVDGVQPSKHKGITDWLIETPKKALKQLRYGDPGRGTPADIFVVGFQEMVSLTLGNIIYTSDNTIEDWRERVKKCLDKQAPYVCLASKHMVGLGILLMVRVELAPHLSNISVEKAATGGPLDMAGNKGAVAVRCQVFDTSMCFVCCHLAHGEGPDKCKARGDDYDAIVEKLTFSPGGTIYDHEYVFWFGDFNYRLRGDMEQKDVVKAIKKKDWWSIVKDDELLHVRCSPTAFAGFNEGPLLFAPTYKYKKNSNDYSSEEKPSWNDRVLWMRKGQGVTIASSDPAAQGALMVYNRAELKTSNHRPVIAVLDVPVIPMVTPGMESPPAYNAGPQNLLEHPKPAPAQNLAGQGWTTVQQAGSQDAHIVPGSLPMPNTAQQVANLLQPAVPVTAGVGTYAPTARPQALPAGLQYGQVAGADTMPYRPTSNLYPILDGFAPSPPTIAQALPAVVPEVNVADTLSQTSAVKHYPGAANYDSPSQQLPQSYRSDEHTGIVVASNSLHLGDTAAHHPGTTAAHHPPGTTVAYPAYSHALPTSHTTAPAQLSGTEIPEILKEAYMRAKVEYALHPARQMAVEAQIMRAMVEYNQYP